MSDLNLFIHGMTISITCSDPILIERLSHDFSLYQAPQEIQKTIEKSLTIFIKKENCPLSLIPPSARKKQISRNSTSYDMQNIRYNDYHGKALTIFDYKNESGIIISHDRNLLHELTYLLILSRNGKFLDRKGLHKFHAFGVTIKDTIVLGTLPMKQGKTTLFLNLLESKNISIISDDSPLITRCGNVLPFPIRIGIENKNQISELKKRYPELQYYTLNRQQYGLKYLVDVNQFPVPIYAPDTKKTILLFKGKRSQNESCFIHPLPKIRMFYYLMEALIIGIGLPMIKEYYLEHTIRDYILIMKIGMMRTITTLRLLHKAKTYTIILGNNPSFNAKTINRFLEDNAPSREQ